MVWFRICQVSLLTLPQDYTQVLLISSQDTNMIEDLKCTLSQDLQLLRIDWLMMTLTHMVLIGLTKVELLVELPDYKEGFIKDSTNYKDMTMKFTQQEMLGVGPQNFY